MDYFQAGGGALAQLGWSSPSTAPAIIPQSQLYPTLSVTPVLLNPGGPLTNGSFQLQVSSVAGQSYVFQSTTDLVHWISLSTNVAPSNIVIYLDTDASNFPARFYRAVELP
jgi:hypothetical protein